MTEVLKTVKSLGTHAPRSSKKPTFGQSFFSEDDHWCRRHRRFCLRCHRRRPNFQSAKVKVQDDPAAAVGLGCKQLGRPGPAGLPPGLGRPDGFTTNLLLPPPPPFPRLLLSTHTHTHTHTKYWRVSPRIPPTAHQGLLKTTGPLKHNHRHLALRSKKSFSIVCQLPKC